MLKKYLIRQARDLTRKFWRGIDTSMLQRYLYINYGLITDLALLFFLFLYKPWPLWVAYFLTFKVTDKVIEHSYLGLCYLTAHASNVRIVGSIFWVIFPILYTELQLRSTEYLHGFKYLLSFRTFGYCLTLTLYFLLGYNPVKRETKDLSGKALERKIKSILASTSSLAAYQTYYKSLPDKAMIPDFLISAGYRLIVDSKNVGMEGNEESIIRAIQEMSWRRYDVWIPNCAPLILMIVPLSRLKGKSLNQHNRLLFMQGNKLLLLTDKDKHLIILFRDYTSVYFCLSFLLRLLFIFYV